MKTEDIRITQYALGELAGAEREAFEKEMATNPELLEEVRQTQSFCEPFPIESETKISFSDTERTELRERWMANRATQRRGVLVKRIFLYGGIGVAASVMIGLSVEKLSSPTDLSNGIAAVQAPTFQPLVAPEVEPSIPVSIAAAVPMVALDSDGSLAKNESLRGVLIASQDTKMFMATTANAQTTVSKSVVMVPVAMPSSTVAESAKTVRASEPAASSRLYAAIETSADKLEAFRFVDEETNRNRSDAKFKNHTTEGYDFLEENAFLAAKENPLSTFSIDVDTASYSNVRRFLQLEQLPPKGAVRVEELINYFPYTYPQPEGKVPFSVNVEVGRAPWNSQHELVRVALKGRELPADQRPASNLVFLIDVSGSMNEPNKLPLLQRSLSELTKRLAPKDHVAIVVYAGSSGLVLPSTSNKGDILNALDRLKAGGSTNGGDGIELAYGQAREHFINEGNNRVILCTDGDFNVGVTNEQALVDLIEKERTSGVFLSVLGFGSGNLKDSQMEKLADKGNGNYAYIDSPAEGRKVLVEQMGSTLFAIAKDVKIQVEFNPATVAGYRLIGYENRLLAKEDFNDDKKDAGEIGAGHTVTAFYEVVPAGQPLPDAPSVDPLKYQKPESAIASSGNDLLTVKLRYKEPESSKSELLEVVVPNEAKNFEKCSSDFQFASAVTAFGLKLRDSKYVGDLSWAEIQKIARPQLGEDPGSYRAEFLTLLEKARQISQEKVKREDERE